MFEEKEIFNLSWICKTCSKKRFVLSAGFPVTQGLKLKLLREAIVDNQSNLRAALWRWRNNGGTWSLPETAFASYFLRKLS